MRYIFLVAMLIGMSLPSWATEPESDQMLAKVQQQWQAMATQMGNFGEAMQMLLQERSQTRMALSRASGELTQHEEWWKRCVADDGCVAWLRSTPPKAAALNK